MTPVPPSSPSRLDALTAPTARHAHRLLVAKAIREFTHERLLTPVRGERVDDAGRHAYTLTLGGVRWTFTARALPLEHLGVDPDSVCRAGDPDAVAVDRFVLDAAEVLGLAGEALDVYLEELASTFAARCHTLAGERPSAADLVDADYTAVEAAMSEGHPGFVATNGRIGWGATEYAMFAPEGGRALHPVWLAFPSELGGRWTWPKTASAGAAVPAPPPPITEAVAGLWAERAAALDVDPEAYTLIPVHPWQWEHRIQVAFAPDLAAGRLVHVGEDPDAFTAMQAVRTLFNASDPHAPQLKTALSVQNMGFVRGLSPAYMSVTPAINALVADLVDSDPLLARWGFGVLREYASAGYTGDAFHAVGSKGPHTKMLAALWRESPLPRLAEGERVMTMAALLHRDGEGRSVAGALVERSGLTAAQWLHGVVTAYVTPLVHLAAAYSTVFMPHGENIVLRLREGRVTGAFLKDIGEEVVVGADGVPLTEQTRRIRIDLTDEDLSLSFFTDMLDGVLRHLADVMDADALLPAEEFYAVVGRALAEYTALGVADVERLGLDAEDFAHSCLNRLQLRNATQMVDLTDPSGSLLYAGRLANPVAAPLRRALAEIRQDTAA